MITTYDAKDVSVIVGGVYLTGLAEGSFVSFEKDEESRTPSVGAQGDVAVAKVNNPLGTITVTLQQTSPQIPYLNSLAKSDTFFETRVIYKGVIDEKVGGTNCYIKRPPSGEYADEVSSREVEIAVLDFNQD